MSSVMRHWGSMSVAHERRIHQARELRAHLERGELSECSTLFALLCDQWAGVNATAHETAEWLVAMTGAIAVSTRQVYADLSPLYWGETAWLQWINTNSVSSALQFAQSLLEEVAQSECPIAPQLGIKLPSHRTIEKIKELIHAEYAQDLGLSELARRVYLSPNYMSRFFKQVTGQTVTDYLIQVRMESAKRLLVEATYLKTYEVGEKVGYADPVYFSKLFKRMVGVTPAKYRDTQPNISELQIKKFG